MDSPRLPRRTPTSPQLFQPALVARGIHGLPESRMKVRLCLPFGSQALHRFLFKHPALVMDLFDDRGGQDKETAVDPAAFAFRLFLELANRIAVDVQSAE